MEKAVRLNFLPPTSSVEGTAFYQAVFQMGGNNVAPFKGGKFIVCPGVLSKLDQHSVRECWIIAEGCGTLYYDGQEIEVSSGDYCYFESNKTHQILNHGKIDLIIYSNWWDSI